MFVTIKNAQINQGKNAFCTLETEEKRKEEKEEKKGGGGADTLTQIQERSLAFERKSGYNHSAHDGPRSAHRFQRKVNTTLALLWPVHYMGTWRACVRARACVFVRACVCVCECACVRVYCV